MFRTSWIHHEEGSLYTHFLSGMFYMLTQMPEKHTTQKLSAQTVFLMMNPRGSKHVENVKNRIKALI